MLLELRDSLAQTPERQAVRGQRERGRGQSCVAGYRVEEKRERVSLRFVRPNADVGRNPREHHVAGDEDVEPLAVERCVFGRMAVSHDDLPIAAADAMRLPVHQAPVAGGKAGHPAAIIGAALLHQLELFSGESVAHEHRHRVVEAETRASLAHRVRGEILGLRHPEFGAGALGQPRGETRVIGMMVRDDEAPDRAPRDASGEDALPQRARGVVADAAVDECPALAIFEQPEVDVVERKRQRHAQPVHAGRDLQGLAGRWRSGVRILQDGFAGHALWMARGARSRIQGFPRRKVRILADYGAARHKTVRQRPSISPMNEPSETYSIAELAREFDVTHRAIRFYEDEGLLSPGRDGTRRVYSKRDWVRLKLILRGKRLGFSLAEVHEMLELYDSAPDDRPQLEKFVAALAARREQLERQREEIDEVLGEIRAFERQSKKLLNSKGGKRRARLTLT